MQKPFALALTLLLGAAAGAPAQDPTPHDPAHHRHHSPYAQQEPSGIAALSLQEVQDLEAGAGMGMARAAELNHYPGPKHVLELAEGLGLGAEQKTRVEEIRLAMSTEARRLGAEILELERHLDRRFAHRHIDERTLRELTAKIAVLQGELRAAHLVAHLQTTAVLTPEQVAEYDRLRGYGEAEGPEDSDG